MKTELLNPAALARYDAFALHVRRGMGERPGERRFPGRPQPSGIELEAYSAYTPGDDLRYLDWNAFGRLDALLVRRFVAEREVPFHLLLDASASMRVPGRDRKLGVALELALALGYMALAANDAVRVALLGGGNAAPRVSPLYRQRVNVPRLAEFLASVAPAGTLELGSALSDYARVHPQPGAALLISDLMMAPVEVERGIQALVARGYEVHLLHVIGASELDPGREFTRAVLTDVESGATHPMVLTATARAHYDALLAEHLRALADLAARSRATYARLVSDADVSAFVTGELARLGLVRRR